MCAISSSYSDSLTTPRSVAVDGDTSSTISAATPSRASPVGIATVATRCPHTDDSIP